MLYIVVTTGEREVGRWGRQPERHVVVIGEWGETSATFTPNSIPKNVKLFKSEEDATEFAIKWMKNSHPWHVKPVKYDIYEIVPKTIRELIGYEVVSNGISN